MSPAPDGPSRQDVLDAFAVEPDPGRATLERYLRDYPQFATELLDLSRILASPIKEDASPLSSEDQARIDAAWVRHAASAPAAVLDPFFSLSVAELREIAARLGVPRQVLAAFRSRRISVTTVPRRFLRRLAESVNTPMEHLVRTLSLPPASDPAHSFRSDQKPIPSHAATFEQVLIEAGVPGDERARLMSESE